jgi:outer membrane protein OmpA-like peptidoglycan-associated protein
MVACGLAAAMSGCAGLPFLGGEDAVRSVPKPALPPDLIADEMRSHLAMPNKNREPSSQAVVVAATKREPKPASAGASVRNQPPAAENMAQKERGEVANAPLRPVRSTAAKPSSSAVDERPPSVVWARPISDANPVAQTTPMRMDDNIRAVVVKQEPCSWLGSSLLDEPKECGEGELTKTKLVSRSEHTDESDATSHKQAILEAPFPPKDGGAGRRDDLPTKAQARVEAPATPAIDEKPFRGAEGAITIDAVPAPAAADNTISTPPPPSAEPMETALAEQSTPQDSAPIPLNVAPRLPEQIDLSSDLLFRFGQADLRGLSERGKTRLIKIAQYLNGFGPGVIDTLRVVGHTDRIGGKAANLALSQRRAETIKDQLIKLGVDANTIEIVGAGSTQPVASCEGVVATDQLIECLSPNRRIVVEISFSAGKAANAARWMPETQSVLSKSSARNGDFRSTSD